MLFFRRYPRFTLLLSFLLTASLLLLLTHTPFPSLQTSFEPPTQPLNPPTPTSSQGLAARVRRAERAYQKMLLGRDALIAKVGPTPHNVALCVSTYPSFFLLIAALMACRFPPDKEPWPPYTVCKSTPLLLRTYERPLDDALRGLFSTRLFLPTRARARRRTR